MWSEPFWWLNRLFSQLEVRAALGKFEPYAYEVGSQETPGVTGKFGLGVRNEAGQRLIEFCQVKALVTANTLFQQHKRRLYTWTSPDGQHRNQVDIFFAAKDGEALYSQQKQDWELTVAQIMNSFIAKFRLKLKKVRKITRPFRYDVNKIPYNYTVELRNRFKGLDLIECLMNYGWRFMTLYRRQGSKPSPRKRNAKKQNGVWGDLKIAVKKREAKSKGEKERHTQLSRVSKNSKER